MSLSATLAHREESITLRGTGFSFIPAENSILIDDVSTSALSYTITQEGHEEITFKIPSQVLTGTVDIFVIVQNHPSNPLTLTILP